MRWARDGFLLLVFMLILRLLHHPRAEAVAGVALIAGSVWFVERAHRSSVWLRAAWMRRLHEGDAITLTLPFRGRWKALGCGPNAEKNHHLAARDQWFAVDWVRVDGESMGSEVLCPVDGVVVHLEDGHTDAARAWWTRRVNRRSPAGNYVTVEVTRKPLSEVDSAHSGASLHPVGSVHNTERMVFVLLCHLQRGSVRVAVGQSVGVGEVLGLCGNSGNSSRPHVHIHAQDRAQIAVGRGKGVPIRFRELQDEDWIEPGTEVTV